jgi:hypothetical protein
MGGIVVFFLRVHPRKMKKAQGGPKMDRAYIIQHKQSVMQGKRYSLNILLVDQTNKDKTTTKELKGLHI